MNSFKIENIGECTIVYGPIPIQQFSRVAEGAEGKNHVIDPHVARLLQASLAVGPKKALEELANDPQILARAHAKASAREDADGLSPEARMWLAVGQQGSSSQAIFENLLAVSCDGPVSNFKPRRNHPLDADDFRRCMMLLDTVPGLRRRMNEMASVSPAWGALVENWGDLEEMMEFEVPEWAWRSRSAPRCDAMIRGILASVESRPRP